jgi:hypothetical protein
MREIENRGKSPVLPSNGLLTFDGKTGNDQGIELGSAGSGTACISDIFLHGNNSVKKSIVYMLDKNSKKTEFNEKLNIYPNMIEIRQTNPFMKPSNKDLPGIKDVITEFSKKSRREFIKFLCKITDILNLWQDVTFSDDVMQNKSERKKVSNDVLNRFRRIVLEKYPSIKIVYKREWMPRKSGNLQGEYIPHFHMFISAPAMSENYELIDLAVGLARTWVDCTRTKEIQKALRVAIHPKSYRIIKDQKHALKYATKYVAKPNGNWTEESIGRSWGTIGKLNIAEPKVIKTTPTEMAHVKRIFRKIAPKKHFIQKALRKKETPTFLIIKEETVNRILEHTQHHLENERRDFINSCVPEVNEHNPNPLEIQKPLTKISPEFHQEQLPIKEVPFIYLLRRYEK